LIEPDAVASGWNPPPSSTSAKDSPESFICSEFPETFINFGEFLSFSRDDQHVVV
jgi:hypothetical protein